MDENGHVSMPKGWQLKIYTLRNFLRQERDFTLDYSNGSSVLGISECVFLRPVCLLQVTNSFPKRTVLLECHLPYMPRFFPDQKSFDLVALKSWVDNIYKKLIWTNTNGPKESDGWCLSYICTKFLEHKAHRKHGFLKRRDVFPPFGPPNNPEFQGWGRIF